MEKVAVTTFLFAYWVEHTRSWGYHATATDMSGEGWVKVEEKIVEFDRPGPKADWSAGAIKSTRKEQQRIRAEAEVKIGALETRIQSLQALPGVVQS